MGTNIFVFEKTDSVDPFCMGENGVRSLLLSLPLERTGMFKNPINSKSISCHSNSREKFYRDSSEESRKKKIFFAIPEKNLEKLSKESLWIFTLTNLRRNTWKNVGRNFGKNHLWNPGRNYWRNEGKKPGRNLLRNPVKNPWKKKNWIYLGRILKGNSRKINE